MKKPALAGYSHVEGRRPGRPLHCDLSPSPPFPRERGNGPENRHSPAGKGERQMSEGVVLHRPSTWPFSEKGERRDEVRRAILMKEDKHGENPPVLPAPGGKDAGGEVQNRLRITRNQPVTRFKLELAKQLRKAMTPEERMLWSALRNNALAKLH